jgi:long-chain acyl-CoA synthetase
MADTLTVAGGRNLARLAEQALERLGDHPALLFEGAWHSSAALADRAARVGAGLRSRGVRPGDRVVVLMANCPEVGVTYTGIWRAGAVAVPVIFLAAAGDVRHIVLDSQAAALVTTAELLPKAREATAGLDLPLIVAGAGAPGEGGEPPGGSDRLPREIAFAELEAEQPGTIADRRDDDLAALLYTGGTTGRSKGVMLTHANLCHAGAASRAVSNLDGVTRGILPLPLSHAYGVLVTVGRVHATEPQSVVLMRWFDPEGWLALAQEQRAQTTALVPSMIAMLLAQPLESYDLSSLRYVYSGAAPLPLELARELERRVPTALVLEGYGCTESSSIIAATPPGARRLGSVGIPVPGVEVRIVADDGTPLAPGQDGEIVLRGPNVMAGYWHDQEETAQAMAGGWLHTGDIGHLDHDGYLTIVDRKKDLIIRGGFNVFPRDVEDVLVQHPGVAAAAVVGRPDARLGEEVVAFVALRPGARDSVDDLIEFARERLAATKSPREIRVVEAIPLTPVGKADRKRLRAQVAAESRQRHPPP